MSVTVHKTTLNGHKAQVKIEDGEDSPFVNGTVRVILMVDPESDTHDIARWLEPILAPYKSGDVVYVNQRTGVELFMSEGGPVAVKLPSSSEVKQMIASRN